MSDWLRGLFGIDALAVTKSNPNHEPAGSSRGGQFASAPGGGSERADLHGESGLAQGEHITKRGVQSFPSSEVKPVKVAKFHRGDLNGAMTAAARSSLHDDTPRYIYATQAGYQVTHEKPKLPPGGTYTRIHSKKNGDKVDVYMARVTT